MAKGIGFPLGLDIHNNPGIDLGTRRHIDICGLLNFR